MFAEVDGDMVDTLSAYRWCVSRANGGYYAVRGVWDRALKSTRLVAMHRSIIGAVKGQFVDHVDGDTMNNRRDNLRICTNAQNIRNMRPHAGRTTKGVHFMLSREQSPRPWQAYITHCGHRIHLGYFASAQEAQAAYNASATRLFGEFAHVV